MDYLADTVAMVRHLTQDSKQGKRAKAIFQEADQGLHRIFVSGVTLMEILYLSEAKRIAVPLAELVSHINKSRNYAIIPIDAEIVLTASRIDDIPELHDRMIAATALFLDIPILSPDPLFVNSHFVRTVW